MGDIDKHCGVLGKDQAILTIGAAHLREVQDVFARENVSYVMIAVPGVPEVLKELRRQLTVAEQAVKEAMKASDVRIPLCQ